MMSFLIRMISFCLGKILELPFFRGGPNTSLSKLHTYVLHVQIQLFQLSSEIQYKKIHIYFNFYAECLI